MAMTLRLTTMPATKRDEGRWSSVSVDLFGRSLGSRTITVSKLGEIAPAVKAFGDEMLAANPGASFTISVVGSRGDRKIPGYDAAQKSGAFGHEAFVVDEAAAAKAA